MEEDNLPEHINNLWEDMDRLNALYEELMWPHDVELEFSLSLIHISEPTRPY